jgi:hypothetical protein
MKCLVALSMMILASAAWTTVSAAEKKTYSYICKGGGFTVTATVDRSGDVERWSRSEPVVLQIAGESPQMLTADPDAPDADSYRNKDYEFYALKKFITLTHKSHGVTVKFYNACRVE